MASSAAAAAAAVPDAGEVDPTLKTIQFTTVKKIFQEVDNARGDALIVKSIPPEAFLRLDKERERQGRRFLLNLYNDVSQHLVLTITTRAHTQLHMSLNKQVEMKISAMGLADSWESMGSATYYRGGASGSGGCESGPSGEGDSSGGPLPERDGPRAFPTLMIEAGYSQSLEQMQHKARFWFGISNHDIKMIILAKLYRSQRMIVLERWEERQRGVAITRWGSQWVPSCHQAITITETSADPPIYQVTGDLVLSFQQLLLRNPRAGESDIVISVADLQIYARRVWMQVVS